MADADVELPAQQGGGPDAEAGAGEGTVVVAAAIANAAPTADALDAEEAQPLAADAAQNVAPADAGAAGTIAAAEPGEDALQGRNAVLEKRIAALEQALSNISNPAATFTMTFQTRLHS